jgi:1,2-diacylglycerol 3-alpha-glucosyltransferase
MIIFFITNNYKPYSGGVVSSIDSAVAALRAQGHMVFIITLSFSDDENDEPHVLRIPCPIKFKYKKNHMAIAWRAHTFLQKKCAELLPDIMHVHHPFLLGMTGLQVARKQKIPVVFTYHTLYEHYTHYVPFIGSLMRPVVKKWSFDFCNKVDAVIAPSKTMGDYVRLHAVSAPVHVIPSGIAARYFQEKKVTITAQKKYQLLTVSRFAQEKSIPFLLDAFALLDAKKFSFTLVGYGAYGDFLRHYAYDVLKLLPENVQFVERPEKHQLAQFYASADLFIFASQTETQGLVVCEAMGSAVPVVARRGPGQQDIVVHGVNGFLVDTHHEMAEKITEVADHGELQKKLSAGAWHTAQQFKVTIMVEKLVALYTELIL